MHGLRQRAALNATLMTSLSVLFLEPLLLVSMPEDGRNSVAAMFVVFSAGANIPGRSVLALESMITGELESSLQLSLWKPDTPAHLQRARDLPTIPGGHFAPPYGPHLSLPSSLPGSLFLLLSPS